MKGPKEGDPVGRKPRVAAELSQMGKDPVAQEPGQNIPKKKRKKKENKKKICRRRLRGRGGEQG